jgi:hypothetical protein
VKSLRRKIRSDEGAIIVEATLSLPIFIFAIFIILSIVNICSVQAKVGVALGAATKEISQYSYLYYAMHGDDAQKAILEKGEKMDAVFANVGTLIGDGKNLATDIKSNDLESLIKNAGNAYTTAKELDTQFEAIANDPLSFMIGLAANGLDDLAERGKAAVGQYMAKLFMKKNLVQERGGDPDLFLRSMHVVDGIDGLYFSGVSLMAHGKSSEISLTVTYQVQVIKLLGFDKKLTFTQTAKTNAWGLGGKVSKAGS